MTDKNKFEWDAEDAAGLVVLDQLEGAAGEEYAALEALWKVQGELEDAERELAALDEPEEDEDE